WPPFIKGGRDKKGVQPSGALISTGPGCLQRLSSWELPVEPVAEGAAHDQLLIMLRQPRQLLCEERYALLPGAWHARDVRPPEHAFRAEGIVGLAEIGLNIAKGIGFTGVARRPGSLDRHVRILGQRQELRQIREGCRVLRAPRSPQVIDDQP